MKIRYLLSAVLTLPLIAPGCASLENAVTGTKAAAKRIAARVQSAVSGDDELSQQSEVAVVTTDAVPGKTCTPAFHFPAVIYQQFKDFSIGADPLQQAAVAGLEEIADVARKYDANAVLNVRTDFGNRTELDEGRVLVYGTLAKCQ